MGGGAHHRCGRLDRLGLLQLDEGPTGHVAIRDTHRVIGMCGCLHHRFKKPYRIAADTQVLAVFVSFMVLLKLVKPDWGDVFFGFVPSKVCPFLSMDDYSLQIDACRSRRAVHWGRYHWRSVPPS